MMRTGSAAMAMAVVAALWTSGARATDPCAGHDVACDADGCLVCWTPDGPSDVDLVCEEMSLVEVSLTLPGCVGNASGLDLVAPQGARMPELVSPGGRTVLPEPPASQRTPGTDAPRG